LGEIAGGYLQMRGPLRGLALVMDVRHPLTELDQRMLRWFGPTGKPVHVLLAKADKLSREAAHTVLRRVEGEIGALAPNTSVQLSRVSGNLDSIRRRRCFEGGWIRARRRPSHRAAASEMKTPGKTRGWK